MGIIPFMWAEEVKGLSLQPALGAGVWCEGLGVPQSTALPAGLIGCSLWRGFEPAPIGESSWRWLGLKRGTLEPSGYK